MATEVKPAIVVLSSLFPSSIQKGAGVFVRERMFRVGRSLPVTVVAPTPWFPFQGLIRRWRPHFRPGAPRRERQGEFDVSYPRFLSIPGVLKSLDGLAMALGALPMVWRLKRQCRADIIDAHFGYPDGYAATLLGRWLDLPVTITLRGTEVRHANDPRLKGLLVRALERATRIFAVSSSLMEVAIRLGVDPSRIEVVGNGVDIARFFAIDQADARVALRIPPNVPVLVSVGGLVERKGFHRIIELLPELRIRHPGLVYLIVGGASLEGDWTDRLIEQVRTLNLDDCVHFLGTMSPDGLRGPLSAADVFVLATANEGWANVFLEAMACGLPVVATDVGGNREVVSSPDVGIVVPFGDSRAMLEGISTALNARWDRTAIRRYAEANAWDGRIALLVGAFRAIHASMPGQRSEPASGNVLERRTGAS